jgi:hypothetical protein
MSMVRRWLFGLLVLVLGGSACGEDRPSLSSAPVGGGGGSGGLATSGGQGGFRTISGGSNSASSGTGGRPPDEVLGETVLTFLHGIVDAERVRVCFVKGRGKDAVALGSPVPEDGLAFGESLVVRTIEGLDFATDEFEPVVISGELERIAGLDCTAALAEASAVQAEAEGAAARQDLDAGGAAGAAGVVVSGGAGGASSIDATSGGASSGAAGASGDEAGNGGAGGAGGAPSLPLPEPPALRVGALPILPARTLAGRSYLYVADGCIGGPAFATRWGEQVCGAGYGALTPTLGAVFVAMSRQRSLYALSLQAVGASLATDSVDVVSAPIIPVSDVPPVIASLVHPGSITPRFPRQDLSTEAYGANSKSWQVEVMLDGQSVFAEYWDTLRSRAGVTMLEDAQTYALVLIGPRMNVSQTGFWNPRRIVLLSADP